jgi:hypothetical protein
VILKEIWIKFGDYFFLNLPLKSPNKKVPGVSIEKFRHSRTIKQSSDIIVSQHNLHINNHSKITAQSTAKTNKMKRKLLASFQPHRLRKVQG